MPQAAAPTETMDHNGRIRSLQALLSNASLDALLVTHLPNIRYLTGFTGSSAVVLVDEQRCTIFTERRL
jgi:Xaa-Pro aminopeptidase